MTDESMEIEDFEETEEIEEPEFVLLDFEDGTSESCEVIGVFDVEDKEYIALLSGSDAESVYLYGYLENEDGSFELIDIEDDDEFNKASDVYEQLTSE